MNMAFKITDDIGATGRAVRESLSRKNQRSQELTGRTRELMNMGSAASIEMPFPVLIDKGEGPYLIDADGNRYIDFQIGFGSLILGHRHPVIQQAIMDQVENRGWQFGLHNPNQVPLAEQVIKADNCVERLIFCNTGTESTMYAIRAARAFTGKPKIGVFDGFYHGAHDYGIGFADPASPRDAPVYRPVGAGVLPAVVENQLMLPYRSQTAFDLIRKHKDELAMVMIEAAQSSNPHMNDEIREFLHELRAVCTQSGVLMMMDEVITGFRFAYGGAQEFYGVKPDLATYGKALGGGLPVGAVGGRADIMRLFNALHEGDPKGIMSGGTFSGNPLTMAAGYAQVRYFDENRDAVYPHINGQGERLARMVNDYAHSQNMAVQVLNAGSMFQIYFRKEPIRSSRDLNMKKPQAETEFYLHLLDNGVLVPGTRRSFVSYVHSPELIDEAVARIKRSLDLVREDGLI
jgi:glutamate-1-semialdehyde 2,1-aminomutase